MILSHHHHLWLWCQWLCQQGTTVRVLGLLLSLLLFLIAIAMGRSNQKEASTTPGCRRLPPSPPKLPFIGNLHHLISKSPYRALAALSRQHGPLLLLHLGHAPTLMVSSAALAEEVMKIQGANFADRPAFEFTKVILYNNKGMSFLSYGEQWQNLRKVSNIHLLGSRRLQSNRLVREDAVASMLSGIESRLSSSSFGEVVVDLREIMKDLMMDMVTICLRGGRWGDEALRRELRELLHEHVAVFWNLPVGEFYPCLRWVDVLSGLSSRVKRLATKWDRFLDKMIEDHLRTSELNLQGSHHQESFVDALLSLQAHHDPSSALCRETIKALMIEMVAASYDTSSVTLEWAMAELVHRPEMMKRAQAEVREAAGAACFLIEEPVVSRMSYLKAVIKETLRFHPAVPLLLPHQSREETHIGSFFVPKHTRVLVNAWAIMRDPESWEAPEEFIPERFLKGGVDVGLLGGDPRYIPFGIGRRVCPGAQFGMSAMQLALANLLHRFDWKIPDGVKAEDLDMGESLGMNPRKRHGLRLIPIPRVQTAI